MMFVSMAVPMSVFMPMLMAMIVSTGASRTIQTRCFCMAMGVVMIVIGIMSVDTGGPVWG